MTPQVNSVNEAAVKARIAGRDAAPHLIELLDWPDGHGADYADALCHRLRELLPKRKVDEVKPPQQTPIAHLGVITMPFGVHAGKSFDDIPLEYLDWLCRSQEDFYKSLRAYLKHPELESRRGPR